MAKRYPWQEVNKIKFTDDDIAEALDDLAQPDTLKSVATLTGLGNTMSAKVVRTFSDLAVELDGTLTTMYGGLQVLVPKTVSELREQALYDLRYNAKFEELRDQRAEESGVEPMPEEDK